MLKVLIGISAVIAATGLYFHFFRDNGSKSSNSFNATPRQLSWIRILVCLAALLLTLLEDLPRVAEFPREFGVSYEATEWLLRLPGYSQVSVSRSYLALLQWATFLLLFLAMLGVFTRFSLPLAGLSFFYLQAILRYHAISFHEGVLPIYLLLILTFTPCSEVWSFDSWWRSPRHAPSSQAVRFSVFLCFFVVAAVYVSCGFSKLGNSGLNWLQPENLEFKILRDAMNPLFFREFRNPAIWLHRHDVPIFSYSLIGIFTVSAELSYIAIFFSKWARVVIPILIFSLHTGILVFQRILFLDLMILQLIFINANWLALWARRNKEIPPDSDNFIRISKLEHRSETACPKQRLRLLAFIVISAGISAVWIYRIERFPLSAWQMYSDVQTRMPIVYFKVMATRENGEIEEVNSHLFCRSVMINSYMMLIPSLNSERMSTLTEVITNYIDKSNKALPPESRIKCIEIEKWNWDYWEDPKNPNCGKIVNRYAFYAK